MGHEPPNIIEELDFVLTHPDCNAAVVEKFYHNCLIIYKEVPLFSIVNHMRKVSPRVLNDWSRMNKTVQYWMSDLEPKRETEESTNNSIKVDVDLSGQTANKNGIYLVSWESSIEEHIVKAHFKARSLMVIDKRVDKLVVIGVSKVNSNLYHLYVKKRRHLG
ncbi:hypothetical protein GZH47_31585 (plasmid) [Paenibacillus rhizovicinus]|uniref:Uncharacterized protein n=1 Tax=Paenibacillus rhizovicinus TaxID=2704463 RepID=A0A6C0PC98_9BACL|nr:hypothetical protein [Paenibacillus rhizovicinus]QHW35443.1 hypothetical protein GZH47_31585 [Paenibacillus rhizovicinus]